MVRTRPTLAHFVMGSDPTTKPNPQSRRADSNRAELLLALLAALPHQPKVAARGLEALFDAHASGSSRRRSGAGTSSGRHHAKALRREDAGPLQSFDVWRCVHCGTSAANRDPSSDGAGVLCGDPRLPRFVVGRSKEVGILRSAWVRDPSGQSASALDTRPSSRRSFA